MLKTTTVGPDEVTCVFSCEECDKEEKETISNIACDGAPMCTDCNTVMEIDYVIIQSLLL